MFTVYCHNHHTNVLLDESNIVSVANEPQGIVVHWECYCGYHGSLVRPRRSRTLVA